jgi:hypothetical protein
MGKVAIVGVEGSGKTVLMAGLCECFKQVPGSDDPYLIPENQAAFKFMETVPYMLRVKRQWPAATGIDNLRAMRWSYRCGHEVLETVELLDYPGELYRLAFGDAEEVRKEDLESKRDEVKKFLDHLIDADTLLVLLNLSDVINLGENHKNLETVWITRGILSYAKKLKNVKHTVLVFTQADRYATELKAAGGPEGLYSTRLPMLKTLFPKQEVMAVSAVSATDGSGCPIRGYSSEGCQMIMRCILADQSNVLLMSLSNCEASLEKIEGFNSGNPKEFLLLVDTFSAHVESMVQAAKPFSKIYEGQVKEYQRDASRLCDLARDLKQLVGHTNTETLAKPATWRGLERKYSDVDLLFVHFRRYFQEESKKQITLKKEDKKTMFIVVSVLLICIGLAFVFAIKGSLDEQARQRKVKKAESERIEAEKKLEIERNTVAKRLTSSATGMEFVWIPAIKIWVGKYEVTNGEYRKMMKTHDSKVHKELSLNGDRQPVVYVSFDDARAYAAWLTEQDKPQLGGMRYRLISESEWLTVAQCGDGREYPWGNTMPPKYGNYLDSEGTGASSRISAYTDGYKVTCDVDKSGRNDWGLYGVGGNVWECCASDSSCSSFGAWRGASWDDIGLGYLRCASRLDFGGSNRFSYFGFRLVLSL